ncbi:MAG: hypothetical protein FWH37_09060 [Candidatus Bathyarchaeota archaeon]|nr:hypothetical protein [Candidatus Termiticorpusculum sp.]
MVNFNKGSSTWGSYSSPNGTQKLQANINTTIIEPGQSAYCASPVKEFETFFASFPASNDHSVAALEQLQSGDPVRVKNHVASQFPGMVIEWVRVSWDGVIQPPVLLPAGVTYQLLNYRYEFLVTNKNPVTAQKSYSWKNHYATFITDQENLNLTCNTKNTTPLTHDMTFSPFVLPAIAIYIIVIAVVAIVVAAAVMFLTSAWQAWQIIRPALKSGAAQSVN